LFLPLGVLSNTGTPLLLFSPPHNNNNSSSSSNNNNNNHTYLSFPGCWTPFCAVSGLDQSSV
jgi:hypothetical protein